MSWGEVKKFLNSGMNTPLDILINNVKSVVDTISTNVNDVKSDVGILNTIMNNVKSVVDTINTNVNTINTNVNTANSNIIGVKQFTANGTFIVPAGVNKITVTAIAAGASGNNGEAQYGGKGGDRGEYVKNQEFIVKPGESIPITVGSGNTIIGSYLTLAKGGGGGGAAGGSRSGYYGGGGGGGAGGLTILADGSIGSPANSSDALSGDGAAGGGIGAGAGGKGTSYPANTAGGAGGNATFPSSGGAKGGGGGKARSSAYSGGGGGAGGGYGAGGGGGGNTYVSATNTDYAGTGGAGANGIVIIEW